MNIMLVNKGEKEIIIKKSIEKESSKVHRKIGKRHQRALQRLGTDITKRKDEEEGNDIVTTTNITVCLLLRVSEKQHVSFFLSHSLN